MPDNTSQPQIIDILTKGLERLSSSFPWLAGQVVRDGNPELSKIIPFDKTCHLIIKDLTYDGERLSMDTLRKANFPSSMLDGTLLTPLVGPPTSRDEDAAPVFFLQANFIKGGLLLVLAGEHSAMDGQGLGQVIGLFSKACCNDPFADDELLQGNRARSKSIPLLDASTYKPGPELDYLIVKPRTTPPPPQNSQPPQCTWAYFHFPSTSLSKLKSIASSPDSTTSTNSSSSETPAATSYITTNDAVSAFIWQSTSRIRASRLPPATPCTFARAVDVRSALGIRPTYLGNMSNHTYHTLALSSISSSSLGALASALRRALNPSALRYGIRSLATQYSLTTDVSSISYGANMDLSTDVFLSSWAKLACYAVDFSLGLGFPESIRRPRFSEIEGLMYLMPMDRSGGCDAAVCLRDQDLDGLKRDRQFMEYAEWIG